MSKIMISTDCNANLDYMKYDYDIKILRSVINFEDEHYVDGLEIKADDFYSRLLKNPDIIPSTSAPTLGECMNMIEELIEQGYTDLIHYPISFELSSTGKTVLNLKEQYKDRINIHVLNTKTACSMQGFFALEAARLNKEGKSAEEIIEFTQKLIDNTESFFVVRDLKYLVKNGRLSVPAGFLGNLLKLKPILQLNSEGKIVTYEKIRTHTAAIKRLIEIIKEKTSNKAVKVYVYHSLCYDEAKELKDKLLELNLISEIEIYVVTPAVGAHIGTGILGIGYTFYE